MTTYTCRNCGRDIGSIQSSITTSGTYATESGTVQVALNDMRATVLDGSGLCEDHGQATQAYDEPMYMNIGTGSVDTREGWFYEDEDGNLRNAVDEQGVVQVIRDENGDWVEA